MRLDKFLKVSRLIKRRTLAKEICDGGKVKVNDHTAKAGTNIQEGDILEMSLGPRFKRVKILKIQETVPANEATSLYEEIL